MISVILMPLSEKARKLIEGELIEFSKHILPKIDLDSLKKAYPFHSLFFTDDGLRAFKVQRRLVTRLGTRLIPRIAKIVAEDKYGEGFVYLNYSYEGKMDAGMEQKIDEILDTLQRGEKEPDANSEWNAILASANGRIIKRSLGKLDFYYVCLVLMCAWAGISCV